MANWWADKIAARRNDESPSAPATYYPQGGTGYTSAPQAYAQPPQPQGLPAGWVAYQTPQGLVYGPPQVPMVGAQPFGAVDTSQIVVTRENIGQVAGLWRGGRGMSTETQPCPKCGSPHYFSRGNAKGRGPMPAPLCMTCGFNGIFEQASAEAWGDAGSG